MRGLSFDPERCRRGSGDGASTDRSDIFYIGSTRAGAIIRKLSGAMASWRCGGSGSSFESGEIEILAEPLPRHIELIAKPLHKRDVFVNHATSLLVT